MSSPRQRDINSSGCDHQDMDIEISYIEVDIDTWIYISLSKYQDMDIEMNMLDTRHLVFFVQYIRRDTSEIGIGDLMYPDVDWKNVLSLELHCRRNYSTMDQIIDPGSS